MLRKRSFGLVVLSAIVCLGGCVLGCAFIKPTTQLSGGALGWEFVDTKDNDIALEGASFDPASKTFKIEKLIIGNKSSPVIEANVQQMLAFVEQQKAANEGIKAVFAGLSDMMNVVRGTVSDLSAMRVEIATVRALMVTQLVGVAAPVPTSQPVNP